MPTTEQLKDRTLDAIDRLPAVEVPAAGAITDRAVAHKVRTALIVAALGILVVVIVRKAATCHDETETAPGA